LPFHNAFNAFSVNSCPVSKPEDLDLDTVKVYVTAAKHSVTKKTDMFADMTANKKTAFIENMKNLDLNSRLRNLSEFRAVCGSLSRFGLSKNEAKVYVYLAKFGEQKAYKISKSLSLHRTETYKVLRRLEERSLVYRILEKPIQFGAVPIEKALDTLIQVKKQRIDRLGEEKKRILDSWAFISVPRRDPEKMDEFIQVLKGKNQIYIKINEIIENAKDEILIAASDENLLQLFYSGTLDDLASKSSRIKTRLMTDSSLRSSYIVKKLKLDEDEFFCVNFEDLPSFIISNNHFLLFLNNEDGNGKNGQRALWSNQKDLIEVLKASFFSFNARKVALKPLP